MSKPKFKSRLAPTEARAVLRRIRTSPRKLNLVAQSIRGLHVNDALVQLTFSNKGVAPEVKKLLQSAVANAENNHQLDVDRLYVAEAHVGQSMVMKRFAARARGRGARILKPFSHITIIVRQREGE